VDAASRRMSFCIRPWGVCCNLANDWTAWSPRLDSEIARRSERSR
jgi:hypothetical protein